MPTKTTTKTAARKPATARKPVKAAAASVKAAPEPKRKEAKSVKAEIPAKAHARWRHVTAKNARASRSSAEGS